MNDWTWRIILSLVALFLTPIVVSMATSLAVNGVAYVNHIITGLFRPLAMSGEARLQALIKLCLYLVSITLILRFLLRK